MTTSEIAIALFTAVIAVTGIIGTCIFHRQLNVMQGQLDTMVADQRPWVGLHKFKLSKVQTDGGFEYVAIVKNGGKTPALKVRASFTPGFLKQGMSVDTSMPQDCENLCSVGMIMPDSTIKMRMTMTAGEIERAMAKAEGGYYVLGRVDYEDATNHYWTTICWYYDITLRALGIWSSNNDVFSEKKVVTH